MALEVIGVILAIVGSFILSRPLTCFIHEMGHAIPALFFTKEQVQVFIGSYGDASRSFKMNLGRLKLFWHRTSLLSYSGLCVHGGSSSLYKNFLITLMGPLFSLATAVIVLLLVYQWLEVEPLIQFLGVMLAASSFLDFRYNIVPSSDPIAVTNGNYTYNDGAKLLKMLKSRNLPESYYEAYQLVQEQRYHEAIPLFEQLKDVFPRRKDLHNTLIECWRIVGNYEQAEKEMLLYASKFGLKSDDKILKANIEVELGKERECVQDMNKILKREWNHVDAIMLRAYAYHKLHRDDLALEDIKQVISIYPTYFGAYTLRARIYTLLRHFDEAEESLQIIERLDGDKVNSYTSFAFGLFKFEKEDYRQAYQFFSEAEESYPFIPELSGYMERAKAKLPEIIE